MGSFIKLEKEKFLTGQFLVATPVMDASGDVFARSVVYVVSHNETGAVGLVVNTPMKHISYSSVFSSLNIESTINTDMLPIYFGGPVEAQRGFVLHTSDYEQNNIFQVSNGISLSSNIQILQDIASGNGPKHSIFALGYAGWQTGQLESEIASYNWINVPFSQDLMFSTNNSSKWQSAMQSVGINGYSLSSEIGHA